MATGDKLFYSYNSPWIHNNSLKYSENYTYSMILNKTNHKIIHDGVEYGTFHNSNYISCIPSDAFVNSTNTLTLTNNQTNYFCIKVPCDPVYWDTCGRISFDVTLSSTIGCAEYNISGSFYNTMFPGTGAAPNHGWNDCWAICKPSNSNLDSNVDELANLPVGFRAFRSRVVGSTHCYWPMVIIGPLQPHTLVQDPINKININISNISITQNLNSNEVSYNFIDGTPNIDHKWHISVKTSLGNTYFLDQTISNTSFNANKLNTPRNIYGQPFNGTQDVYESFKLDNNNYWNKDPNIQNSYVLRTTYLGINCSSENTRKLLIDGGINGNYDSNNPLYAIFTHKGYNFFSGPTGINAYPVNGYHLEVGGNAKIDGTTHITTRTGIGTAPTNTAYMLNVAGKTYTSEGFYTYGNQNSWGHTDRAAININHVSRIVADQTIQLFCMNSHNYKIGSTNAYSYWHAGIYTNYQNKFTYYQSSNHSNHPSSYNFLIWNSSTGYPYSTYAWYSFSGNPEYRGTVAITSGTSKNIVCLGIVVIYRTNNTSNPPTWYCDYICGSLSPRIDHQPTDSLGAASNQLRDCFVGLTFTKYTGFDSEIIKANYVICSAIPVVTSNFSANNYEVVAEGIEHHRAQFSEIMAWPTDNMNHGAAFSRTKTGPYLVVWGRRQGYDNDNSAIGRSFDDAMVHIGDGSIASIRITIFGYWKD